MPTERDRNPHACSDGACVFRWPLGGMHTNSGCRCIHGRMSPDEVVRARKAARWLRDRLEELAAADEWFVGWRVSQRHHERGRR